MDEFTSNGAPYLDQLRAGLRRMNDEELRRFGESAADHSIMSEYAPHVQKPVSDKALSECGLWVSWSRFTHPDKSFFYYPIAVN
jgi:hypothetical protein